MLASKIPTAILYVIFSLVSPMAIFAAPGGFPVEKVLLFQDGEEVENGRLDFNGGIDEVAICFPVPKEDAEKAKTGLVSTIQFWAGEEGEVKPLLELRAPGQGWKIADAWEVSGQSCVLVAAAVDGDIEWHAFRTRNIEHLGSLPGNDLIVQAGRARFTKAPPDKWMAYFPPSAKLNDDENWWRDHVHEFHVNSIKHWHQNFSQLVEEIRLALKDNKDLADANAELPFLDSVLSAPAKNISPVDLTGEWKVRSIQQGSGGSVFAYPWFKATIKSGNDGLLDFEKTSGSQRRSGKLYRNNGNSWVFLGGRSMNDDPKMAYIGRAAGDEPASSDTYGVLIPLGSDRFALVMDLTSPGGWEIYELKKY